MWVSFINTSTENGASVRDYIHENQWGVITHPNPDRSIYTNEFGAAKDIIGYLVSSRRTQSTVITHFAKDHPDSKVHGANMGSIWGRQDPGGPHVGPMSFAIWAGMR